MPTGNDDKDEQGDSIWQRGVFVPEELAAPAPVAPELMSGFWSSVGVSGHLGTAALATGKEDLTAVDVAVTAQDSYAASAE